MSPDYEEDGSVNNILDAFGERVTTASGSTSSGHGHRLSGAVSWSVLDGSGPGTSLTLPQEYSNPTAQTSPPPPQLLHTSGQNLKSDESSGVGTDTLSSISPTGSSGSANRATSPGRDERGPSFIAPSVLRNGHEPEEYEHVYCQLDPYFVSEN